MRFIFSRTIGAIFRAGGVALLVTLLSCDRRTGTSTPPAAEPTTAPAEGRTVRIFKATDPAHLKLALVGNGTSSFWNLVAAGAHKYEKESGIHVEILAPAGGGKAAQNDIIQRLVREGYQGIAISAVAPNDQVNIINEAAAVTNVICFDSDCPRSNRILYVGTHNYDAGRVVGAQIVRLLPQGGQIGLCVGNFAGYNAAQRLSGIQDAIRGHNIQIVAKLEDARDRARSRADIDNAIATHDELNLLCGLYSYEGPIIAAAIEASGKKGKILAVGFDEDRRTLAAIKAGVISCTVLQKPYQFGYLTSRWLHELAREGSAAELPEDGAIDTGVRVIDQTSVGEFEKELAEIQAQN